MYRFAAGEFVQGGGGCLKQVATAARTPESELSTQPLSFHEGLKEKKVINWNQDEFVRERMCQSHLKSSLFFTLRRYWHRKEIAAG